MSPNRRFPHRTLPILAAVFGYAGSALAGDAVLYRCTDGNGTTAFTNTREGFSNCREAARYPRSQAAPARAPAASTATPARAAGAVGTAAASTAATTAPATSGTSAAGAGSRSSGQRVVRTGKVYRFGNDDGVMHYTNVQPGSSAAAEVLFTYTIETCVACQIRSSVDFKTVALRLDEYRDEVAAAALAHGVDEALVRAVIHAESAFRSNARSHKNAQGLMQLIPATAERFGVSDAYDPVQNISGGVQYLAWLLRRFNNDVRLATAGYNAGEGNVDRHGGVPPFAETQVYVERVGILHARYRAALDAAAGAASVLPTASVATFSGAGN